MDTHRLSAMDQDWICSNVLKGFTSHNCDCVDELAAYMTAVLVDSQKQSRQMYLV